MTALFYNLETSLSIILILNIMYLHASVAKHITCIDNNNNNNNFVAVDCSTCIDYNMTYHKEVNF